MQSKQSNQLLVFKLELKGIGTKSGEKHKGREESDFLKCSVDPLDCRILKVGQNT